MGPPNGEDDLPTGDRTGLSTAWRPVHAPRMLYRPLPGALPRPPTIMGEVGRTRLPRPRPSRCQRSKLCPPARGHLPCSQPRCVATDNTKTRNLQKMSHHAQALPRGQLCLSQSPVESPASDEKKFPVCYPISPDPPTPSSSHPVTKLHQLGRPPGVGEQTHTASGNDTLNNLLDRLCKILNGSIHS